MVFIVYVKDLVKLSLRVGDADPDLHDLIRDAIKQTSMTEFPPDLRDPRVMLMTTKPLSIQILRRLVGAPLP